MAAWAASFADIPEPRIAFSWLPEPSRVVLDLAIQAAGRTSVPVSPGASRPEGCAWVETPGENDSPVDLTAEPGGVVVRGPVELSQADLISMAEGLQRELPPARPGEREILVLAGDLADPAERTLLAWATVAGAALLLEPDRESLVGTAVWARPTIFAGTVGEVARLRQAVEREGGRRWWRRSRLPFSRLRAVIQTDQTDRTDPSDRSDQATFWTERGVRLLPQSGKAVV